MQIFYKGLKIFSIYFPSSLPFLQTDLISIILHNEKYNDEFLITEQNEVPSKKAKIDVRNFQVSSLGWYRNSKVWVIDFFSNKIVLISGA